MIIFNALLKKFIKIVNFLVIIMAKVDSFKELSKKQDELLKKDFYFGSIGLLTLNLDKENYRFHSRLGANEAGASYPIFLSAWQEFKSENLSLKIKRGNDGVFNLALEILSKKFSYLKSKVQYRQEKGSTRPSVSLEYLHDSLRASAEFTLGSIHGSLTFGRPEIGLGIEGLVDLEHGKANLSTIAGWWFKENSKFLLKHETVDSNPLALGKFEASFYRKIEENFELASKVKCDWVDKAIDIEAVGNYKCDKNHSVKGKVSSLGKIAFAWKNLLSENINTIVSAETSADSLFRHSFQDIKFGFRLNINQ